MANPLVFLRQVRDELSKVTWPTQQEATRLTILVIVVSIAVGLYVGGLDLLFTKILASVAK